MADTSVRGTLLRVERNGFGVVQLDGAAPGAAPEIAVFTAFDRAADAKPAAFRPDARITASGASREGNLTYLQGVRAIT